MLYFTQIGDVFKGSSKLSAQLIKNWSTLGLIQLLILGQLWCEGSAYLSYGAESVQEELLRHTFQGYNTLVRPVRNLSDAVHVNFGIVLNLIISVNERDQVFKSNIWYRLGWNDPQLSWVPEQYGNIQSLRMPADRVWTPDIVLLNNADGKYGVSYKSNVVIYNRGDVIWLPPTIYKSTCEINVRFFPFDIQTCSMRFKSWTWNAQEVLLESFEDGNFVDLSDYTDSGTWDILEARGHPLYYYSDGQPRMEMVYQFVIRRRPLFYTVNLLIPTCLVTFLTVLVFYLPTASGEKVALSISISVTLVFFLLLVSKNLPPSKELALMAKYLLFAFIMNFISVLVTVCVIHMHYKSPKTDHAPPKWIQYLFFSILPTLFLMRRPRRYRHLQQFSLRNFSVVSLRTRTSRSESYPNRSFKQRNNVSSNPVQQEAPLDPHDAQARSLSTAQAPQNLARSESITSDLLDESPQVSEDRTYCMEAIATIANSYRRKDFVKSVEEDWKFFAAVIDRGLLWVFFIVTSAGSLGILIREPEVFEYVRHVR